MGVTMAAPDENVDLAAMLVANATPSDVRTPPAPTVEPDDSSVLAPVVREDAEDAAGASEPPDEDLRDAGWSKAPEAIARTVTADETAPTSAPRDVAPRDSITRTGAAPANAPPVHLLPVGAPLLINQWRTRAGTVNEDGIGLVIFSTVGSPVYAVADGQLRVTSSDVAEIVAADGSTYRFAGVEPVQVAHSEVRVGDVIAFVATPRSSDLRAGVAIGIRDSRDTWCNPYDAFVGAPDPLEQGGAVEATPRHAVAARNVWTAPASPPPETAPEPRETAPEPRSTEPTDDALAGLLALPIDRTDRQTPGRG
jgi:hypothetical protein